MASRRIDNLLDAYFHRPIKDYAALVSEIRSSGGLTAEEAEDIARKLLYVDARTIIRQASSPGPQAAARHSGK